MVTRVPVDTDYEYPRTELTAMADNMGHLILDIDKLDTYRRTIMEELKHLRDFTLFYGGSTQNCTAGQTLGNTRENRRNSNEKKKQLKRKLTGWRNPLIAK